MKNLLTILLAATTAFSLPQVPAPQFSVSSRVYATTSPATFAQQVIEGKTLYGVNVTDGAVAPRDPIAAVMQLKARGVNLVDLHHPERVLRDDSGAMARTIAFMDVGKAEGIRFSFGLSEKLGELYPKGIAGFIKDLYAKVPEAESLYRSNIAFMERILKHPALFKITLVNEGAQHTTPQIAAEFFQKWAPVIRKINPNLLLTDCADAWSLPNPRTWDTTIALYDVHECNFYGTVEDFHSTAKPNWIVEGWAYRTMLWARNSVRNLKKMPFFVGEFGSYGVNPNHGSNEMFLLVQAQIEGWSTCQFAYATNQDGWDGRATDKYAITTNPLRMNVLLFGAYLRKNATGLKVTFWDIVNWGPKFTASGDKVQITQDFARVGSNVWNLRSGVPAWAALTKGF